MGRDWSLVYSTARHGISLQTLYRNMANYGDSPTVLLVKDENGKVCGLDTTTSQTGFKLVMTLWIESYNRN